jgi:hypothetical protein
MCVTELGRQQLQSQKKRVFKLSLEHYPNYGGELEIIAAILERANIEKILKKNFDFSSTVLELLTDSFPCFYISRRIARKLLIRRAMEHQASLVNFLMDGCLGALE